MSIEFLNILQADAPLQEKVRQWRNKDDVREWMFNQALISSNDHQQWLESLKIRNDREFWVVMQEKTPIGAAYLHDIDHQEKCSEWGFYIGEDDFKGKGLSKEILAKLLAEFFETKGYQLLRTKVFANNETAINLYRKFHFKEKETIQHETGSEVIIFELTKAQWQNAKKTIGR